MVKKTEKQPEAAAVHFAQIRLDLLSLNDYNARRFEENMTEQRRARFTELVGSVRSKGILEPLLVRLLDTERYEVIAGERRYRAALEVCDALDQHPGEYLVPCMVSNVDDDEAFDIMVTENLHREDLTPFEAAQSFLSYLERHGNSVDSINELAARTGIPPHAIRRQVSFLALPYQVISAWKAGQLTQSHMELLTRVGDPEQVVELTTTCLRLKSTVRDLAERIGTVSPDLERGAFDKTECQSCPYNTSIQSGLFSDISPAGKCGNAACFERKQGAYFTENWERSKACEKFGTLGFRFGHRLPTEHREVSPAVETSGRCLLCESFISVLRLTGAVIPMYERTCLGPVSCYTALYCEAPAPAAPEPKLEDDNSQEDDTDPVQAPAKKSAAKPEKTKNKAPEETGPVFSALRGAKAREAFYRTELSDALLGTPHVSPRVYPLILLALALSSPAARIHLCAGLGIDKTAKMETLAESIFDISPDNVMDELYCAACAQVTDQSISPEIRLMVARHFNVDLATGWRLNKGYLDLLNKSELIRIGEEPGVLIWQDEKVKAYKQEHHKGKALMALKQEELVAMILNSGADLAGRIPAEVLGERKG
jgi:ParB family transcriptional regulator, chromosome partitioning protein